MQTDIYGTETRHDSTNTIRVDRIGEGLMGVLRAGRRAQHFTLEQAFERAHVKLTARHWMPVAKRAVKLRLVEHCEEHLPPEVLRASGALFCSRVFADNGQVLNPLRV